MSTIRLPAIILPEARLRGRQLPDVTMPAIDLRRLAAIDLRELRRLSRADVRVPASLRGVPAGVRDLSLSDVRMPELAMPVVHLPDVRLADRHLSDLRLSDLHRPSLDALSFDRSSVTMPRLDLSHVEIPRVEVRIIRAERRGPSRMTLAAVVAAAAAAAGWWLWTSPATAPRVRAAARRARRRIEQRWPSLASQPELDETGTEQFWSQAEGWRPEGGGFEPGDVTMPAVPKKTGRASRNGDPAAMAGATTREASAGDDAPATD